MCHETCPHPISGGEHLQEHNHTVPVGNEALPLFVVMPERSPAPAVLILHDIYGPGPFYQDLARRLAAAGYIAALPDLFFRQGPLPEHSREAASARRGQLVQENTFGDIAASLTWLKGNGSGNGRVATLGMCLGGTLVLSAASREPAPNASVAFYGFPVAERTPNNPILPIDDDEITRIDSPLLGFWGEQDASVGIGNVLTYDEKLHQYDIPHEFVMYPDVGHGFLTFDPDADAFSVSQDAWTRTLSFLADHLGANAGT